MRKVLSSRLAVSSDLEFQADDAAFNIQAIKMINGNDVSEHGAANATLVSYANELPFYEEMRCYTAADRTRRNIVCPCKDERTTPNSDNALP
jgi:hypothetical protein